MSGEFSSEDEKVFIQQPSAPPIEEEPVKYEPVAYGEGPVTSGPVHAPHIGYNVNPDAVPKYVPIVDSNQQAAESTQIRDDEEFARSLQEERGEPQQVYLQPMPAAQQSNGCCKKCCGVFFIVITLMLSLCGVGLAVYGGINLIKLHNAGAFMGGGIACATIGFIAMVWACIATCVCFRATPQHHHIRQQQYQYGQVPVQINVHGGGGGGAGFGVAGVNLHQYNNQHNPMGPNIHDQIRRQNEQRRQMEQQRRQTDERIRRQQDNTRQIFDNQRQMFERQHAQDRQRQQDNTAAMFRQQQQNLTRMNQQTQQRNFQMQQQQHNMNMHNHHRF